MFDPSYFVKALKFRKTYSIQWINIQNAHFHTEKYIKFIENHTYASFIRQTNCDFNLEILVCSGPAEK